MKKSFFLLFVSLIIMAFAGCRETENTVDEDTFADNEISDESNDESTDESAVTCTNEWEKAEIIEDPEKFYGFKITTAKRTWKWKTANDIDTVSIMTSGAYKPSFMHITEEGYIILIGGLNGEICAECFNEFMHIYKPDGTLTAYGMTGIANVRADMASIDEKTGDIVILFNFDYTVQDGETYISQDRFFVASFKDSSFKFQAWQIDTENMDMCDDFFVSDGNFHLLCMSYYSKDGSLYDRFKTKIVSGINGSVYYKTSSKDSGPIGGGIFQNTLYVSIVDMDNDTQPYLQKYSTDTLCMEEQIDNAWNDKPIGLGDFKYTENGLYGFTKIIGDDVNIDDLGYFYGYSSAVYIENTATGRHLISAGILSKLDEKGHRTEIDNYEQLLESDGSIYMATSAMGDYDEDGSPTDEELAVMWQSGYELSYNAYITAIDKDWNAYIKPINNGLENSMAFQIAEYDDYIYVAGSYPLVFDPESNDRNLFFSRIKKDLIIKEENLASEKSVRIQKFE